MKSNLNDWIVFLPHLAFCSPKNLLLLHELTNQALHMDMKIISALMLSAAIGTAPKAMAVESVAASPVSIAAQASTPAQPD